MGEYLFLWLELNGFRRVSKTIKYIALSYTTLILGGLALAIVLNLAALGLNQLSAHVGRPAAAQSGMSAFAGR